MRATVSLPFIILLFGGFANPEQWIILLDKDLSQWETYLSYRHRNGYNGKVPTDDAGKELPPIGYNKDTFEVFSVLEEDGELILRVSGEVYGCLYTREEFENYHLTAKVKWGDKKYEPRLEKLKDSGILYHSVGEAGVDYWRSWMLSQEFQIMEGHMGDYWPQATSGVDIRAYPSEGVMNSIASPNQPFRPFGAGSPDNYCLRSENFESPAGEWTTLELICFAGSSLHIVNGNVVMILKDSRYKKDANPLPLAKGKIQLQSEAAEVFFKDIRIRKIEGLPLKYHVLFQEE